MTSNKRSVIGWVMYDWANSAFATTVLAGFFPVFFRSYWNSADPELTTIRLGVAHSITACVVAFAAPTLGVLADRSHRKKASVLVFAALGSLATLGLYFVPEQMWVPALLLLFLSTLGFACGNTFYDALLVDVCEESKRDRVSNLGYGVGYLGGGILFAINIAMVSSPQTFGISDKAAAVRISFVCVALWWFLFSVPLLLWVAERPPVATQGHYPNPFVQLGTTLRKICGQRNLLLFLLAYFCYIDGVNTVIKMAVEYFQSIDIALETSQIMLGLLTVQFVGFPAALLFVKVGEKLGAKRGIMICIGVYAVLTVWSFMVHTQVEFFCMAVVIGSVIGGIQALSRSLYSRLIPQDQAAEYFGIYNILGKFAAIAGPLIVGVSSSCLGPRFGLISLLPLFIIGGLLLARVRTQPLQGR